MRACHLAHMQNDDEDKHKAQAYKGDNVPQASDRTQLEALIEQGLLI